MIKELSQEDIDLICEILRGHSARLVDHYQKSNSHTKEKLIEKATRIQAIISILNQAK